MNVGLDVSHFELEIPENFELETVTTSSIGGYAQLLCKKLLRKLGLIFSYFQKRGTGSTPGKNN